MDLSDRKKQILKSIIDAYINSGEPVGSKNLAAYGNISLSPATIRNEMSELESLGYLDKPHTSAGRVPSAQGYKFYVDQLNEDYRLGVEELELLGELTRFKTTQIENIIDRANKIMSGVTKYAAVSLAKNDSAGTVLRFDAVYIGEHSFLLVMILESGNAKTAQLSSEFTLTENDVRKIKDILNTNLCSVVLDKISLDDMMALEEAFGKHRALVGKILRAAYSVTRGEGGSDVRIDGLTNLLSYPEFSSVEKARSIIELAETRKGDIKKLLEFSDKDSGMGLSPVISDESGMKIFFGEDTGDGALADTSLVYCSFPVGNSNAVIGILGPKRMDYKKVVASLKYLAKSMGASDETLLLKGKSDDVDE
ncbi:MAG: heat-inducible transcription repressor HrcA [Clostridia bacterium]|nr:heat-inducible transcription repressor HrcA [Clostridia bacterium]